MKSNTGVNWVAETSIYIGDFVVGPSISAVLNRVVISNPSEYLVAFIYLLGFSLSAFKIWQSVKTRKVRFLERMVYRKQKKNGEELEGGIIDENSVKMADALTRL